MKEVYDILKNDFGLTDKEISIIKVLESKPMNAIMICNKTNIPQGRIYDSLNRLIKECIIERSQKKPYIYEIKDFRENLIWFTKKNIDNKIKAQSYLMDQLKKEKGQNIEFIESVPMYTQNHLRMICESQLFKTISIHNSFPYILYPENFKDFMEMRKIVTGSRTTITQANPEIILLIYNSYMDALKSKKNIEVIFEKETFDNHLKLFKKSLSKSKYLEFMESILHKFETYNISVNIIDEYCPMQLDINEKMLCLTINYLGSTSGIVFNNKNVSNFFDKVFQDKLNRSKSVLPLIKAQIKRIKQKE